MEKEENNWEIEDIIEKEGGSILRTFAISPTSGVLLAVLLVLLVIVFIYGLFGATLSWTLSIIVIVTLALYLANEYKYFITHRFSPQKNMNKFPIHQQLQPIHRVSQ